MLVSAQEAQGDLGPLEPQPVSLSLLDLVSSAGQTSTVQVRRAKKLAAKHTALYQRLQALQPQSRVPLHAESARERSWSLESGCTHEGEPDGSEPGCGVVFPGHVSMGPALI